MATKLSIINAALARIGDVPLSSLASNDAGAQVATALYDSVKENYISSFTWNFALRQIVLAPLANPSYSDEWTYGFQLPPNVLRPLGFTTYDKFAVFGTEIYCNNQSPTLVYIENVAEGLFPAYFIAALETQLASDFAIPITESNTVQQVYEERARRQWVIARSLDSQARSSTGLSVNIDKLIRTMPGAR